MIETLKNAFQNKEIRKKILMTLLILLIFRIGCYIPIPGLSRNFIESSISGNDFLGLMSDITGGALASGTLFALGIGPYINASIIMQLLTVGIPALERLSKQGEEGKKKITNITRVVTIILAVVQSIGIIVNFAGGFNADMEAADSHIKWDLFFNSRVVAIIYMTIVYTAGSVLVMWLGERITEYGIGNGISMIIFIGILSTAGQTLLGKFMQVGTNPEVLLNILLFVVLTVVIFFLIVFVDLAERRIPVQYAKRRTVFRNSDEDIGKRCYASYLCVCDHFVPLYDHESCSFVGGRAYMVERCVRIGYVVICSRALHLHICILVLLCADPVQSGGRIQEHSAKRRIYSGHSSRKTDGAISEKDQQSYHLVRGDFLNACCVYSFVRVQLGGQRSCQCIFNDGYSHCRLGCA